MKQDMVIWIPLNDREIEALTKMRVGLWTNFRTNQTYVHKGYWRFISQQERDAIAKVLADLRNREASRG